jgi:two-component system OmpR family response regulator
MNPLPHSCGPLRVLAVDDDRDTVDTIALLLRLDGHEVRIAQSGNEAVESARREQPDVVLLDLGLPGMDGYEVARRLAQNQPKAPFVIAVSGWPCDQRRCAESGINLHLLKPADPQKLRDILARFERAVVDGR